VIDDTFVLTVVVSMPLFILIGFTVFDVIRRNDLSGAHKVGRLVVVVLLPAIGTLLYLIARPFADPAQDLDTDDDGATALVDTLIRRERGELDDESFAAAKAELFSRADTG
jgi:hypothetical protein